MTDNEYDRARELLRERASRPTGDSKRRFLRERAIVCCLPLATHIAQRYRNRGEPFDDLEQVARIGLVHAVDRFDPSRRTDFLSFAVPTITGEVRRHFRDRSAGIHVPRSAKELTARTRDAEEVLTHRLQRSPDISEITDYLGETEENVRRARAATIAQSTSTLDGGGEEEQRSLLDVLESIDSGFDRVDDQQRLAPAVESLPERERRIIGMRFFEQRSQSDIASRMGISQMHVSRLLKRSLTHLRTAAA